MGGGGGGRPSMGAMMGAMMGGGGGSNVAKTLTLQLGTSRKPTGAPSAEHLPPAGLRAGQSLPLNIQHVAHFFVLLGHDRSPLLAFYQKRTDKNNTIV